MGSHSLFGVSELTDAFNDVWRFENLHQLIPTTFSVLHFREERYSKYSIHEIMNQQNRLIWAFVKRIRNSFQITTICYEFNNPLHCACNQIHYISYRLISHHLIISCFSHELRSLDSHYICCYRTRCRFMCSTSITCPKIISILETETLCRSSLFTYRL